MEYNIDSSNDNSQEEHESENNPDIATIIKTWMLVTQITLFSQLLLSTLIPYLFRHLPRTPYFGILYGLVNPQLLIQHALSLGVFYYCVSHLIIKRDDSSYAYDNYVKPLIIASWIVTLIGLPFCMSGMIGAGMSVSSPHVKSGDILFIGIAPLVSFVSLAILFYRCHVTITNLVIVTIPFLITLAELSFISYLIMAG